MKIERSKCISRKKSKEYRKANGRDEKNGAGRQRESLCNGMMLVHNSNKGRERGKKSGVRCRKMKEMKGRSDGRSGWNA